MALTKVYDIAGKEHEMETVDARECCKEMGWSMTPPESQEKPQSGSEANPPAKKKQETKAE